jgi:hypothetical protein
LRRGVDATDTIRVARRDIDAAVGGDRNAVRADGHRSGGLVVAGVARGVGFALAVAGDPGEDLGLGIDGRDADAFSDVERAIGAGGEVLGGE